MEDRGAQTSTCRLGASSHDEHTVRGDFGLRQCLSFQFSQHLEYYINFWRSQESLCATYQANYVWPCLFLTRLLFRKSVINRGRSSQYEAVPLFANLLGHEWLEQLRREAKPVELCDCGSGLQSSQEKAGPGMHPTFGETLEPLVECQMACIQHLALVGTKCHE